MGTVSGSRCNVRRVSRDGYVCYNGYVGTYPFKTVFRVSRIFSVLRRVGGPSRGVITVITPTVLSRFGAALRRICNTLGRVNFSSMVRITLNTSRAAHHRDTRLIRGLRRNRPFVAASYYPSCVRLTRGRIPRVGGCVSSAHSPVCCATRVTGRVCPSTGAIFVNPYVTGHGRTRCARGISCMVAFRRLNSVLGNVSVRLRGITPLRVSGRTCFRDRNCNRANNIANTIGTCLNNTPMGTLLLDGLGGGGVNLLHTCTGSNGYPGRFVRIVTYRNNYMANPTSHVSGTSTTGTCIGRLTGVTSTHGRGWFTYLTWGEIMYYGACRSVLCLCSLHS